MKLKKIAGPVVAALLLVATVAYAQIRLAVHEHVEFKRGTIPVVLTTGTINGPAVSKEDFRAAMVECDVAALGGTTPTIDITVQDAPPADTTTADGASTAGSATVTSATMSFSAITDIGLRLLLQDGMSVGVPLDGTIISVTNSTTAVLDKSAGATVSSKSMTVYGRPGTFAAVTGATFAQFTTARSNDIFYGTLNLQNRRQWLRLVAVGGGSAQTGSYACGFILTEAYNKPNAQRQVRDFFVQ